MINEEKFHATYRNFDREIVLEIIDIFLKEYDDRVEKLVTFYTTGNYDELSKTAHAFRGVISNFETDCAAYHQISDLENSTRELLEHKNTSTAIDENHYRIMFGELLAAFKVTSKQMFKQLQNMRAGYMD